MKKPQIIIVVGEIASGKTTFAQKCLSNDSMIIELGEIVRDITHKAERTFSNDFDDAIYECVKDLIGSNIDQYSKFIIVGPRSPKLMDKLIKISSNYSIIYLNVSKKERKRRFEVGNRDKDAKITFEEACEKDNSIGLGDLINSLKEGKYGIFGEINI